MRFSRPWRNGVDAFTLTPSSFIARLVPLVPRPGTHRLVYHGVLAAHSALRARVVPERPQPPAQLLLFPTTSSVTRVHKGHPRHAAHAAVAPPLVGPVVEANGRLRHGDLPGLRRRAAHRRPRPRRPRDSTRARGPRQHTAHHAVPFPRSAIRTAPAIPDGRLTHRRRHHSPHALLPRQRGGRVPTDRRRAGSGFSRPCPSASTRPPTSLTRPPSSRVPHAATASLDGFLGFNGLYADDSGSVALVVARV